MSQLSQISDIVADVDGFIQENDMEEDINHLMNGSQSGEFAYYSDDTDEGVDVKPLHATYAPTSHDQPSPSSHNEQLPPQQSLSLVADDYPGPYQFQVSIISTDQKSALFEYSQKLRKIFIGINLKFPVTFSLKDRPKNKNLYIRLTPIFSRPQDSQEYVQRCIGHQLPTDPSNEGLCPEVIRHVIRCTNKKTKYFGDVSNKTRLNIVVPLAQPEVGSDVIKELFYFVCKNSCPMGMDRRPFNVIFTLEDERGKILGRRVMAVRVCSCPKRDKEKEERCCDTVNFGNKAKKRKIGAGEKKQEKGAIDKRIFPLSINIPGRSNYLEALMSCRDRMASEILRFGSEDGLPFKKVYNEVNKLIEKTKAQE